MIETFKLQCKLIFMKKIKLLISALFLSLFLMGCGGSSSSGNNASEGVDLGAVGEVSPVN